MPGPSNYPGGFLNGITIRGVPITTLHPGRVFWVNNSSVLAEGGIGGSNGNPGTYQKPFSTIDYAVGRCRASRGDIIAVMPGYAQTITAAAEIDLDVAGIALVGLGTGTLMPVIEFNHADATVAVGADNVTIYGINFNASITDVLVGVNVEAGADYVHIENCLFDVDIAATDEFGHAIRLVDNNTGSVIQNNLIHMGLGAAVAAIHMDADTANTRILNNHITGDYSTANITGDTTLSTNILIEGNTLINGLTGSGQLNTEPGIQLLTGSTGVIADNLVVCNVVSPGDAIVADACILDNNRYSETVAVDSVQLPFGGLGLVAVSIKNQAIDDADDLFTVTGTVAMWALYATCEVDGTGSPVISLLLDATDGVDVVLATGLDIATVNTDDTITITNGAIAINDAGADTAVMLPMIVKAGVIESVLDSGVSGNAVLKWHCVWSPVSSDGAVADAA